MNIPRAIQNLLLALILIPSARLLVLPADIPLLRSTALAFLSVIPEGNLLFPFPTTHAALTQASQPKSAWRQATDAELAALLPARAPVEKEHIETEMRTASGITNSKGRFIAGVVIITAGYSADGKYSHYLVVQSPIRLGGVSLAPGQYVFGYQSVSNGEGLTVRLYEALTGKPVGTAEAHRIPGSNRVESLRIWPPGDKQLVQIGRFGIPYELPEE